MAASLAKRVLKWTILISPWVLAIALGAGWGLSVWTPKYLEQLVPKMAADLGLPLTEFHIRNAGLFSADIGPVQLGDKGKGLRLSNVHVTYTPASLKKGRVGVVVLDGISLSCSWDGKNFSLPLLDLLPKSGDGDDTSLPALPVDRVVIRDSTLFCNIRGNRLSIPLSATLAPDDSYGFEAEIRPRDQRVSIVGSLGPTINDLNATLNTTDFRLGVFNDFMPVPVTGRLTLALTTRMNTSKPESLTATFDVSVQEANLSALGMALADDAVLAAQGEVAEREIIFSLAPVSLDAPFPVTVGIRAGSIMPESVSAQFTVAGAGVEMDGRLDADKPADRDDGMWDVILTAANPDKLTVDTNGRIIHLDGFIFSLAGLAGPGTADMVLNCGTKGTRLGGTEFASRALRLTLPLKWPAPGQHTPGTLRLSGLRMGTHKLGTVTAQVRQQGVNVAYGGTVFTELLPGLRIPFSGAASMTSRDATLEFAIKQYALPDAFDPATLAPALEDIKLAGTLDVTGGVRMDINGLDSRLGVLLDNGSLTLGEGGTAISGIRLAFDMPDALSMRSAPAQWLSFKMLRAGDILIENGRVAYQLEPKGVVMIEQAGFDWCGGHVSSHAFRVVPGSDEYHVTLFCSELRLSEILSQLGLAKAQGEAALSGELPVSWKNGKISFNSGFLHSTPGEGGTIQVEAMQDLVASIPKGTPQRGQLELAQSAVRDFEYKWVRIKADTVGEDLLVRLSVDGKPKSTLPFVYKKEFGGFMKVTGDVKGSNFQGLRLDVNFSVPLDRILLYKDIVNMIE